MGELETGSFSIGWAAVSEDQRQLLGEEVSEKFEKQNTRKLKDNTL